MVLWRLVARASGQIRLTEPLLCGFASVPWARVRNWEEPDEHGTPIHKGLLLDFETEADDGDDVLRSALPVAGLLVDFLIHEGAAYSEEPRPLVLYELKAGGEFRQYMNQQLPGSPSRSVEPPIVLNRIDYHVESTTEQQNAVAQAQRWYREALRQVDPIDRFLQFVIGLEALEQPLRSALSAQPHYATCPECGHGVRTRKAVGVSKWLDDTFGERTSSHVFRLRAQTVHPGRNFRDLRTEVEQALPIVEEALYRGLVLVLEGRRGEFRPSMGSPWPYNLVVTGNLVGEVEKLRDRDAVPALSGGDPVSLSSRRNPDGSTAITGFSRLNFEAPDGVGLRNLELHLPPEAWEGVKLHQMATRKLTPEEREANVAPPPPWTDDQNHR